MAGVWARRASRKIWDPLLIYATVEASNFKFGTIEAPKALRGAVCGGGVSKPQKILNFVHIKREFWYLVGAIIAIFKSNYLPNLTIYATLMH